MPRPTLPDVLERMSTDERAEKAKLKIKQVVARISGLLALAESNALIVYSPLLSGQIPPSTAGHAFNVFQRAMHGFEIVQLCALWDKPDYTLAHNSIPTVHALIDRDDVVKRLVADVRNFWPDRTASESSSRTEFANYNAKMRQEEAGKALAVLTSLRKSVPDTLESDLVGSVRNLRDRDLAHALERTRAEDKTTVAPMKYGDEKELLAITTQVMEDLYLWITGTNFDLEENRKLQRERAEALWGNCNFSILGR
ncbi:AbiU2 domain-containing protein [Devosia sediminis]|uniref:HEPN AbiU2-like domain-containing protein n=1 Tax=Devosia sediminis TaxID=2798801 RepID=A0A934IVP7_9HYPH|nr:hypothetical protein [Devosia sediminis]MBJ3783658.1 hypothetical protein [Devosia sediminis]